ncbi:tRNA (adenosine(37)-N6)-threonylcarbamoyltransferase complex ATPase subunit type 1 TsaE [Candidatus Gracilibacteria bacterium]|nr:tRNA (adenosine(37)-N6)-threonylcarbamoyltransferase complex ATPase subunit type 1 TsaE [Candidatus Gracilibacteria bacterium]
MIYHSKSEGKTSEIAAEIAQKFSSGGILLLEGDLGSGKTTFTKELAHHLGFDKFEVKSPTYGYIRHYSQKDKNLYHIDLYRLQGSDELLNQEIEEIAANPQNIIVVEWPQLLSEHLKKDAQKIKFSYESPTSRIIEIIQKH